MLCCWPQVKLAKQGSITFLNSGSNEPQYLDLTHLGSKHRTGINVKLPSVNTNGAYRLPSGHLTILGGSEACAVEGHAVHCLQHDCYQQQRTV
jgi:hypothetical protein